MFDLEEINIDFEIGLSSFNNPGYLDIKCHTLDNFNTNFNLLKNFIDRNLSDKIIIFSIENEKTANHLSEIFTFSKKKNLEKGNIYLFRTPINNGFIIEDYIVIWW